jgi:hypothetical protein
LSPPLRNINIGIKITFEYLAALETLESEIFLDAFVGILCLPRRGKGPSFRGGLRAAQQGLIVFRRIVRVCTDGRLVERTLSLYSSQEILDY